MIVVKIIIDLCLIALPKAKRSDVAGIVRLDAIGDLVIWLPSALALIEDLRAKNKRVVLIANQLWASWAKTLLPVDHVISIDLSRMDKDLRYRIDVMRLVRRLNLGTIICPVYSRVPGDGNDALVLASGAQERIGSLGYRSRNRLAGFLRWVLNLGYSCLIPAGDCHPSGQMKSEPEINASFMKGLGIHIPRLIEKLPHGPSDAIKQLHIPSKKYIVIIPGAGWSGRAWPLKRFVIIANELKHMGFEVVVSGSSGERAMCASLASACSGISLAGQTSLQTLADVVRGARLVIGNDSSGIHIAVASGVDSICIKWGGGGHFGRFIPYASNILPDGLHAKAVYHWMDCFGCTGTCPLPQVDEKVPCIAAVSEAAVMSEIYEVLNLHAVDVSSSNDTCFE